MLVVSPLAVSSAPEIFIHAGLKRCQRPRFLCAERCCLPVETRISNLEFRNRHGVALPLRGPDVRCNIKMACHSIRRWAARIGHQQIHANGSRISFLCSGQGPAPTPAPTFSSAGGETASVEESDHSTWLDAAWEVAVTVVGSILVAAGAGCLAFTCRRTRALPVPFRRPSALDFGSAVVEDGKATKQDTIPETPFYS